MFTKHIFVRIHTGLLCITDFLGSISTKNCVHRFIYICTRVYDTSIKIFPGWVVGKSQFVAGPRSWSVVVAQSEAQAAQKWLAMSRVLCHMGSFVTGKARTMIHKVHRQRASGISHYSQSRVTGTDPSVSRSPLTTTTKAIFTDSYSGVRSTQVR